MIPVIFRLPPKQKQAMKVKLVKMGTTIQDYFAQHVQELLLEKNKETAQV